jgi:hypothetical protein
VAKLGGSKGELVSRDERLSKARRWRRGRSESVVVRGLKVIATTTDSALTVEPKVEARRWVEMAAGKGSGSYTFIDLAYCISPCFLTLAFQDLNY